MAHIVTASAEHTINAPAGQTYRYLADTQLHAQLLPPPFYDFQVETGGVGEGSAARFKIDVARGVREIRMQVAEPEPGRTLVHTDTNGSGLVTTYTVTPQGDRALVNITSTLGGEAGVAGLIERIIAPRRLHRVYATELDRLDAYARQPRPA
jgi:uncharacterized protein YndB with AHSA1/START domain